MKNFKSLMETFKCLSILIKAEIYYNVLFSLLLGIMAPALIKLKGIYLIVTIIAGYELLDRTSFIWSIYLKEVAMYIKHRLVILHSIMAGIAIPLYFVIDTTLWLHTILIVGFFGSVFISVFYIDYDSMIADRVDKYTFKDINYIERALFGLASMIGSGISMLLNDIDSILLVSSVIGVLVAIFSIHQHIMFYKTIEL